MSIPDKSIPDKSIPDKSTPGTAATPCARQPGCDCRCGDAPAPDGRETIRCQDGREVDPAAVAAVMAVRSGERVEVVALLHPVTLADCGSYAEARAVQERVQARLDGGK